MNKSCKKIKIFSALEVANLCGVVNQTAINWIKSGYLQAFMTPGGQYRIYFDDFVNFLKKRSMKIPREISVKNETLNLLIIDNDNISNNMIRNYLEKQNLDIFILQAFDGFEAGTILAENKPDIIIINIELPGINTSKLCKKLKENNKNSRKPFIMTISGKADPQIQEKLLNSGSDAFIQKPLDFDKLGSIVEEFHERLAEQWIITSGK